MRHERIAWVGLVVALGGGCTDQVIGQFGAAAETGRGESSGSPASSGGGDSESSTGTSTSGNDSSTSTSSSGADETGVPTPEVCDGVDNDLDGLVDEVGIAGKCEGCDLLQGVGQAWWICEEELNWQAAMDRCAEFGTTLAVVPDAESQAFLHEEQGSGWFWLGSRQAADEGEWKWVDGTPLDYENWGGNQPDNSAPGQDCLRLTFGITEGRGWFDGAWDDFSCENAHRVLCSAPHVL